MTTITTVIIKDRNGNNPITGAAGQFSFDPCPDGVSFRADNTPGKMPLDVPSQHRPTVYWTGNQARKLTIKTMLVGTKFTSQSILDWLNDLVYIMSIGRSAAEYYIVDVPFGENFAGTVHPYDITDGGFDSQIMSAGSNYYRFFVHPDDFSIDKITRNAVYVTLSFSEVLEVVSIA